MLELEIEARCACRTRSRGSVTLFIAADVPELERRLRARATESSGEIDERIEIARHQLEQAYASATWSGTTTSSGPPTRSRPSSNESLQLAGTMARP